MVIVSKWYLVLVSIFALAGIVDGLFFLSILRKIKVLKQIQKSGGRNE